MRLHDEEREQIGAHHDDEQHAADDHRALDGAQDIAKRHAAAENAEQDGAEGADRRGLGRAEDAGIDAADRHDEQNDELPWLAQGGEALAPGEAVAIGRVVRPRPNHGERNRHVEQRQHQAGNEAGGQELRHRKLGDGGIDHQDDRGRNQNVGRAAGRDAAGRKPVVVAGLAQLRQRHPRHGRGIGERGAGHRAEQGRGGERCDRKPAAKARQDHARGMEQLAGQPRARRHLAHQDEQRDDRKRVGGGDVERHGPGQRKRGRPAVDQDIAEEADQDQRDPHRHAQEQQREQDRDAGRADQRRAHSARPCSATAGFATIVTSAQKIVPAKLTSATIQST